MKKITFGCVKSRLAVLCLLLLSSLSMSAVTIEKTVKLCVGDTVVIKPWSDCNSNFSGYTCRSTAYEAADITAVCVFPYITTTTSYYQDKLTKASGFYSTYKVIGLKAGSYDITTNAYCSKKDGTDILTGRGIITYHLVISDQPTVTSITLPSTVSVKAGASYTFSPTIAKSGASTTLKWYSSNKAVLTVSSKGVVKGVAPGSATVTCVAANGIKTTSKVTVTAVAVTSVALNKTSVSLKKAETCALTATVLPSTATDGSVAWTSSDTKVAYVSDAGKVIALSAGECTVTCTANDGSGKTSTCAVTVTDTTAGCDVTNDGVVDNDDITTIVNQILMK